MAYRNKTFVAFDGDNDIHFYRLMCAWHQNDNTPFSFLNAHDLNTARDDSLEDSIKAQLRERFDNSKVFALLVGESTRYLRKFIPWEITQALERRLPIIVVNLNGLRQLDPERCPTALQSALAVHVSFGPHILQFALENWPATQDTLRWQGKSGPYYYPDETYRRAGSPR